MKRPRADFDGEFWPMYLGIGNAHTIAQSDDEETPAIWLPMHKSGSRLGGWRKQPVAQSVRQPLGFRRP